MLPLALLAALVLPPPPAKVPQQDIDIVPPPFRLLPSTDRGEREVRGDLDGDTLIDRAVLLEEPGRFSINLVVLHGAGRMSILSVFGRRKQTQDAIVYTRKEPGDISCPVIVAGRRDCGRGYVTLESPALVLSTGPGQEVVWKLNGHNATTYEVYK